MTIVATSTAAIAAQESADAALVVSTGPGVEGRLLSQSTLQGDEFISFQGTPGDIAAVHYFIDNPTGVGEPVVTGTQAVGFYLGKSQATTLTAGMHTVLAIVQTTSGASLELFARFVIVATTETLKPVGVAGNWKMQFQDEFNGTSLDLNKWSNCWFSPICGEQNGVVTSPANVAVQNGNLVLTLNSAKSGASVSTNPKGGAKVGYQYKTGVVEARIYFPGDGTKCYNWPAWWSTGQTHPVNGENDIAEVLDDGDMTVNYHSSSGAQNQGAVAGEWCGAYHVYTLHRQANKSDVYYDGKLVKSYPTNDGGSLQYLILNVGTSSTPAYGAASQVKVDYVRAWQ